MFVFDLDIFVLDELIIGMDVGIIEKFYELMYYNVYKYGKFVLMIIYDFDEVKGYVDWNIYFVRN